jgi:hypothetical protein
LLLSQNKVECWSLAGLSRGPIFSREQPFDERGVSNPDP